MVRDLKLTEPYHKRWVPTEYSNFNAITKETQIVVK